MGEANVPTPAAHISINASGPEKECPWTAGSAYPSLLEHGLNFHYATAVPRLANASAGRLRTAVKHPRLLDFDGLSSPVRGTVAKLSTARWRRLRGASFAMALGVPTLGVFRQYEGLNEWLPRGPGASHLIAHSLDAISG